MYRIEIVKSALKEISKLPIKEALRITAKIDELSKDPRPPACIKLTGTRNEYSLRIGNYRVLYTITDSVLLVKVFKVRDRKDAY
jgi:mRNA interferase RelE/StbE